MIEGNIISTTGLPSGEVTFLFTDIEGSTRLWDIYPDQMCEAMARHDELIESISSNHYNNNQMTK